MTLRSSAQIYLKLACAFLALAAIFIGIGRGSAAPPQRPQSTSLEFVGEWGMKGENPGELAQPIGLAVDVNNRIYIADRRTGLLQKFEISGVPSLAYDDPSVRTTSALAVDSGGAIYVADVRAGRLWIHYPDGDLLRNFRIAIERAADSIFGFCITGNGTIIVPDPDGGRIQAFTPAGRLESAWKLPPSSAGNPSRPISAATGFDDFVYVADSATGRIAKFTSRGEQVALWEAPSDAGGPLRGIAVSRNHVFALRGAKPQLEVWSFEGQRVLMDNFGSRLDAVPAASLYFAASPDDQVFLLDSTQQRVLRFRLRLQTR
jgi:outer membrane protein assembly factor BamB